MASYISKVPQIVDYNDGVRGSALVQYSRTTPSVVGSSRDHTQGNIRTDFKFQEYTPKVLEDIRARIINKNDTERKTFHLKENEFNFTGAVLALEFNISQLGYNGADAKRHADVAVLKEFNIQSDVEGWTGVGALGGNYGVKNMPTNKIINGVSNPDYNTIRVQVTNEISQMIRRLGLANGNGIQLKVPHSYLSILQEQSSGKQYFQSLLEALSPLGVTINWITPIIDTSADLTLVYAPNLIRHTYVEPQIWKTGTDDRNSMEWTQYIVGTQSIQDTTTKALPQGVTPVNETCGAVSIIQNTI